MLPVVGGIESSDDATDQSTAGCAGDAGACSPLPICAGDAGACEETCPGCFVDGSCVAPDAVNPDNPCLICAPDRDPRAWSNNDSAACDDGLFCTVDDVCQAGACEGAPRSCDDGVACNGVSTCLEDSDSCSAPVSQCGSNAVCDVATDTCKSTCDGCVIGGVCVLAGTEAAGNPCQVCDPTRSTTGYTIATGKSCGAASTACSGQDTCDAQGRCQPNNLPAGTACGSPNSSACDQADACDGNGNCQQRLAQNGTPCDDGAFCTTGDQCQGGQCVASGQQNCGPNRVCNEAANQCQCQGCQVGGTCVVAGSINPANPCQICDPSRSATAYSSSVGATCGAAATECSGQDTCNAQGQCVANNLANGTSCTSAPRGSCQNGACVTATLPPGSSCTQNSECSSGRCETWYRDRDGDRFGDASDVQRTCGALTGASTPPTGYVGTSGDCCDLDGTGRSVAAQIFPGQTTFFDTPQSVCRDLLPFDYNCDGRETSDHAPGTTVCSDLNLNQCNVRAWAGGPGSDPACGLFQVSFGCIAAGVTCAQSNAATVFDLNLCR